MPHDPQPLDLDAILARAAHLYEYATTTVPDVQDDFDQLSGTDTPQMADEIRRLRARVAELEGPAVEARAALAALCYDHEDPGSAALGALYLISQATTGIDAPRDDAAEALAKHTSEVLYEVADLADPEPPEASFFGDYGPQVADWLRRRADYATRAANQPAVVEAHVVADDSDEMAASLRRDGFGDDEIANMLGPGVTAGEAPEPTMLRWGLDDVMWGDDDSITVLLSGPEGEPYWLELDPERAAVLRDLLAGPNEEETHVVADDSDDPEHVDDCPGCAARP